MSANPEWSSAPTESVELQAPARTKSDENPPWTGGDVALIVLVTVGALMFSLVLITFLVRLVAFKHVPFMQVMAYPLVSFSAQMLAYVLTLGFMVETATQRGASFATAVRWNWLKTWPVYILLGIGFCLGLQVLASFLPMPHKNEMEIFFQTPLRAWVLSICGMSLVPVFEEMFFRGFLYPVLARRLGLILAVIFTAVPFVMIHMPQLADPKMPFSQSWGAILVISIIGFALTIVRAVKKSVSAGILMHMAYNGFTSLLAIISTGGFRHLERITR